MAERITSCTVTVLSWRWRARRDIARLEKFGEIAKMRCTVEQLEHSLLFRKVSVTFARPNEVWDQPLWMALYLQLRGTLQTGSLNLLDITELHSSH